MSHTLSGVLLAGLALVAALVLGPDPATRPVEAVKPAPTACMAIRIVHAAGG